MAQLSITLKKSSIGSSKKQRTTLRTLGFTKREQTLTQPDNPAIRGMINQVSHLLEVKEVQE